MGVGFVRSYYAINVSFPAGVNRIPKKLKNCWYFRLFLKAKNLYFIGVWIYLAISGVISIHLWAHSIALLISPASKWSVKVQSSFFKWVEKVTKIQHKYSTPAFPKNLEKLIKLHKYHTLLQLRIGWNFLTGRIRLIIMKIHTYGDMKPSRLIYSVRPFLRKPIFQSFYTIKLTIFAL